MSFTRRTHVVRISEDDDKNKKPGDTPSGNYIDVEILDAIAFRKGRGEEVILSLEATEAQPFIVDDTGGEHGKQPGSPTRRSHMKRIKNKDDETQQLDVEVVDAIAFRDQRGEEWILDMTGTADDPDVFDATTGDGSTSATRRTHQEKISPDLKDKKPSQYLTVQRSDAMAFRNVRGEQMVIVCPSNDDPNSDDPRAETHLTPDDYDATPGGKAPPSLSDAKDNGVYVAFVKDASGFFTGDTPIACGPLWWIRAISGGEILVVQIRIEKSNFNSGSSGGGDQPSGGGDQPAGVGGGKSKIKLDGNFDFSADNVDGNLAVGAGTPPKVMPTTPPTKPPNSAATPQIDMKKDNFWWTEQWNKIGADDFTVLLFLNVAKITKADKANSEVKLTLKLPDLHKADADNSGIGYYIWAISGGDEFTFVPIHPPPDATNAFGPYPFHDATVGNYISLWNNDQSFDATSFARLQPRIKAEFDHIGFHPTDFPASNGGLGFRTSGGAAAWANAFNAFQTADLAQAEANNPGGIVFPPITVFVPLTIDFNRPDTTPPKNPKMTVTVTAMSFSGKTSFDYDTDNLPKFDPPKEASKNLTKKFEHVAEYVGATITVRLAKNADTGKREITIAEA